MVTIQPKSGTTYLKAYQQLVERAKAFDQSELDGDSQPGQVLLDQMVQTGPGLATEPTRVILKAQLQSGPISIEATPAQRHPATRLEFQPSGNQLRVLESYFKPDQAQGEGRTFVIDCTSGAVSDVQQEAVTRKLQSSLDPVLKNELNALGRDISGLGFTIGNPKFV